MNARDLPSPRIERVADAQVPTEWGTFTCVAYRDSDDGVEHLAFVLGDVDDGEPVLVRLHSECLTGDVFGSRRCDCGQQLAAAMQQVQSVGRGVVVYLRGHEGRGIGLAHKIHAYSLQDRGLDTVDANLELGLPVDSRDYRTGADILHDLGVARVRLITNNPAKQDGLELDGVQVVERVGLPTSPTPENLAYLRTKRDRLGHLIDLGD
jgi:3,4-dihydroxy 2-butanone 4-phosphate synthase/GTP cyclohydrolase II